MTIKTTRADRAAIKCAMQRASMFLVTGEAKFDQQRAFHRHLVGHHFLAAAEQALMAGDVDLAHVAHELFMHVHHGEALPAEMQESEAAPSLSSVREGPKSPRRRKLPSTAPGKRERAKQAKAGAVHIGTV